MSLKSLAKAIEGKDVTDLAGFEFVYVHSERFRGVVMFGDLTVDRPRGYSESGDRVSLPKSRSNYRSADYRQICNYLEQARKNIAREEVNKTFITSF